MTNDDPEKKTTDQPIKSKGDLNLSKARVSIYLSGCDVHWFYKANVHDPPEEQIELANQKISTWLWELGPGDTFL